MKRLGANLFPIMLLALACGEAATPTTPLPPDLEATIRALVAEVQSTPQSADEPDTEATITARVQATVRALLEATPIPSPTPTQSSSLSLTSADPTRSSPGRVSATSTPTGTKFLFATPSATPRLTLSPTLPAGCSAAADGVQVSAWINGALAASTLVKSGSYTLFGEQSAGASFSGQTITFKIGGSDADQTVVWVQGDATELDLTASADALSRLTPANVGGPSFAGGPLAQPVPPHAILGTVSVGDC